MKRRSIKSLEGELKKTQKNTSRPINEREENGKSKVHQV